MHKRQQEPNPSDLSTVVPDSTKEHNSHLLFEEAQFHLGVEIRDDRHFPLLCGKKLRGKFESKSSSLDMKVIPFHSIFWLLRLVVVLCGRTLFNFSG